MEKDILKKSGIIAVILTIILMGFWFGFSKMSLGIDYNPTTWGNYNLKKDSVVDSEIIILVGTSGAKIVFGTTTGAWVGTPTDSTLATIGLNTGTGKMEVKHAGTGSSAAISTLTTEYLDSTFIKIVGGTGSANTFDNPMFTGNGTLSATLNANGVEITPAEVSNLDNVTGNIQGQLTNITGDIANHIHNGSGTAQISHNDITGTGTNSHATIDTFISSKGQASGIASLDANSLVVQNPANLTGTPTANKIVQALASGKIDDGWISDSFAPGTPTFTSITGVPSDNQYFREISGTATIPIRDGNGNLHLQGIIVGSETVTDLNPTRIWFHGTITEMTGTQTIPLWYTLKETKIFSSGLHSDPNVLLYVPADAGGSSTSLLDKSSYMAAIAAEGNAVSSSAYSKFGGASLYVKDNTDTARIVSHSRYDLGTDTELYISAFIKMDSIAANQVICSRGTNTGGNNGWVFYYSGGGGNGLAFNNYAGGVLNINVLQGDVSGWSAGTEYHVALRRFTAGGYQLTRNGSVVATGTNTTPLTNLGDVQLGNSWFGISLKGYLDDLYVEKNTNGTSTVPTAAKAGTTTTYHLAYSSYYIPANGTTSILTIKDNGTASAAQIIIGSTTASASTTEGIKLEVAGKVYAQSYLTPSQETLKTVYLDEGATDYLKELKNLRIGEWSWKGTPINRMDAEERAKENYIKSKKEQWIQANQSNYVENVFEPGTGSVAKLDAAKMNKDYKIHIELEWAALLEQEDLIHKMENKMAAERNPERHISAFAGDPTTPAIMQSQSKQELDLGNQIGWVIKVMQAQQREIDNLKAILKSMDTKF